MAPQSPVADWLERFFGSYFRHRPVNATFIGIHDFDDRLPDYSADGVAAYVADLERLLEQAAGLPASDTSEADRIDLRLAKGHLRLQLWEHQSRHFHRGNPSHYTGEAAFGLMSLFLTDFAPIGARIDSAVARLEALPALLARGRDQVREAPPTWTDRAIRECDGLLAFLTDGVAHLPATPALERAARAATSAVADHRSHLATDLRARPVTTVAAGADGLALYLREGHCEARSADEIAEYAERELAKLDAMKLAPPSAAARSSADNYQEVWDQARSVAVERGLLTWPDFPIRFVPRPAWARAAAPHLYFLHYRSPAAFNRPPIHEYLVPPDPPDPSTLKLNHVVHHGGIGHHVQNWHAFRAASRVGRIAAVDCPSRIAMFCGGIMAEGWACYATDLMDQAGFLTPDEQADERRTRARMCARAIVDVRLHQGQLTLEQAAAFYQRRARMPATVALAEATKNSMFPGAALMYLIGTDAIHDLRGAIAARRGDRFDIRAFHDELLSYGSIPISLIAAAMLEKTDAAL